eukprot:11011223-Alexandrium_andersonii.AAC.1
MECFGAPREGPQPTCQAHNARCLSRRDYIVVSKHVLAWCVKLEVDQQAGFDVHSPVALTIEPKGLLLCRELRPVVQWYRPERVSESEWREEVALHARH